MYRTRKQAKIEKEETEKMIYLLDQCEKDIRDEYWWSMLDLSETWDLLTNELTLWKLVEEGDVD